ncbi:MAG TPA: class I SAM-dependent methyltransferase [Actinomycetota bacterium]|jgi:SAM-dependent methyltransferase|nr:class I SAM-dependent methyltransferase [Actinomycetota bacterium]
MPYPGEMKGYDAATYGERVADIYDELYEGMLDTESTVEFLADLAGNGPVLELAIGTGRVALPLVTRGIEVHGIDASESMVNALRAKEGGERIPVTMGDFAEVGVEGRFSLIFVVFNTLFALTSQEEQVRCFRNVAEHLEEGGRFVVEVFVPNLARFDRGQRVAADRVEVDRVVLEASLHDPVGQRVVSQHVVIDESGNRMVPVHIRYAWPSELDLMARLAGLNLKDRWGGWRGEFFTADSVRHISVYEKA